MAWRLIMSNVSLFDLAQQVRDSISQIDPDTGELTDSYSDSRELFQTKAIACVGYAKEEALNIEAAEYAIKQMADKVKARKERLERFKRYMADCMRATGIHEIKQENGLFSAKLQIGRDESIELEDGAMFPASLCNDPKPPTPNKTAIKNAIKAGEAIAGASIVRKDRLTIS